MIYMLWVILTLNYAAYAQSNASIMIPQQSAYGYPWSALAGSDRTIYVTPIAETDSITAWSGNGNVVTFTAANHLEAGDIINIRKMTSGGNFSQNVWQVASATPTSFTINDGTTGQASETTGYLQKIEGPHWTGDGTWEIYTTTGTETFRLYTQDGSQDTGFVAHPTLTHVPSHVNFTVGPTPGAASTSGSITTHNFAIHSTVEFVVKFTLEADPTRTATFRWIVAANGGGSGFNGVAHHLAQASATTLHLLQVIALRLELDALRDSGEASVAVMEMAQEAARRLREAQTARGQAYLAGLAGQRQRVR